MAKNIYDQSTRELLQEFSKQYLQAGQVFSKKDAIDWFSENYPKIKSITVTNHVDWAAVNSMNRRHHKNIKANKGWDLFFRLSSSTYRLWDPAIDPAPLYLKDIEAMLSKQSNLPTVWVEKTNVKGRIDRNEGEHKLGQALWSPQSSKTGGDIYSNMRRVKPGDIVLHLTDNLGFTGISLADQAFDDKFMCLNNTDWAGKPGYRVQLREFEYIEPILHRDQFMKGSEVASETLEIFNSENGKGLFFNKNLDFNQGAYLTNAPSELVVILNEVYQKKYGNSLPKLDEFTFKKNHKTLMQEPRMSHPLNQILYGPPGTGKTWNTAKLAVEICDGHSPGNREALMERYNTLREEDRISFTTFHQSMGYEEFVEGLRPVTDNGGDDNTSSAGFRLEPRKGIFRKICLLANQARLKGGVKSDYDLSTKRFFKMSLGRKGSEDHIFETAFETNCVVLGYGGDIDWSEKKYQNFEAIKEKWQSIVPEASGMKGDIAQTWCFRGNMKVGDIVIISDGNHYFKAIGEITGEYEYVSGNEESEDFVATDGLYCHRRSVKWLARFDEPLPATAISDKNFTQISCYNIKKNRIKLQALADWIGSEDTVEKSEQKSKNYVLIIDEINRANISKVFGELITLIEPDKRIGAGPNTIMVELPYSEAAFGVPDNLYLIGTMNTADRSIALMDTALRRRFKFKEMMPDYSLPGLNKEIEGIHLGQLLQGINNRVEWLYDRDHQIGHSYFLNINSKSDLDTAMREAIIPLLIEYFHEDWEKVKAVLNDNLDLFIKTERLKTPANIEETDEPRRRFVVNEDTFSIEAYKAASAI